jgi:hypothetical protein
MKKALVIALVQVIAMAAVVGVTLFVSERGREDTLGRTSGADWEAKIRRRDAEIEKLGRELSRLTREHEALLKTRAPAEGDAGSKAARTPSGDAAVPGGSPADAASKGSSGTAAGPEKEANPWQTLVEKALGMIEKIQKAGKNPTPELMRTLSEFMADVATLQEKMGLPEPGYVTESPLFQAGMVSRMLEKAGVAVSDAQKAELEAEAEKAQRSYLDAARAREGEFALEHFKRLVRSTQDFQGEMGRVLGSDSLNDLRFRFGGGGKGEEKGSGSYRDTPWPDQSWTGVADIEGAVTRLTRRWQKAMAVPSEEEGALRNIVREYVDRSHGATMRRGSGKPDAEQRRGLDSELVGFQIEALRRIHDTLNLTEDSREKVRGYRSFDRFGVGESGSWSRSGNFGGFVFSSSTETESDGPRKTD